MSPEVESLIEEWREYNERTFNKLVALVQTEAVNGILGKILPKVDPVQFAEPVQEQQKSTSGPNKSIAQLQAERAARKGQPVPVVYRDPADDPNYGMMGSDAHSGGAPQLEGE